MYVTLFLNAFLLHCVALYCFAYSCTASVANKRHHKVWSNFMLVKNLHQSTITARRFLILCVKMLARRLTGANLFCYIHLYISESLYNTVPISASQKHFWPDCKPEGSLFSAEFVCLSVCLSVGPIANLKRHYFQPSLSVCVSLTGTSTLQRWPILTKLGHKDLLWSSLAATIMVQICRRETARRLFEN